MRNGTLDSQGSYNIFPSGAMRLLTYKEFNQFSYIYRFHGMFVTVIVIYKFNKVLSLPNSILAFVFETNIS